MSVVYEAVVIEGDTPAMLAAFDRLSSHLSLRLFQLADRGFALICWPPGTTRMHAVGEVNRLAADLSREFGSALAVHYDDRCGIKTANQYRAGSSDREFGSADELWAPIDDSGYPITDGPCYPANAIPTDIECDCIRQAIDAGLENTGFGSWLTAAALRDWACSEDRWLVQRLGPSE